MPQVNTCGYFLCKKYKTHIIIFAVMIIYILHSIFYRKEKYIYYCERDSGQAKGGGSPWGDNLCSGGGCGSHIFGSPQGGGGEHSWQSI